MTDRSNLVFISSLSSNTPMAATKQALLIGDDGNPDVGLASRFAFLDQKQCVVYPQDNGNDQQASDNCALLNSAPAYFDGGLVRMRRSGSHHVASTRFLLAFSLARRQGGRRAPRVAEALGSSCVAPVCGDLAVVAIRFIALTCSAGTTTSQTVRRKLRFRCAAAQARSQS
jgi:hypothetical protein